MSKTYHCMVDIETTGLRPWTDRMTSLGAVYFTAETDKLHQSTCRLNIIDTFCGAGWCSGTKGLLFTEQTDTMIFRSQHRISEMEAQIPQFELGNLLLRFMDLMTAYGENEDWRIWAKPSTFDICFIYRALDIYMMKPVWHHRKTRDLNTFCEARGMDAYALTKDIEFDGREHHPLDDAMHQFKILERAWLISQ